MKPFKFFAYTGTMLFIAFCSGCGTPAPEHFYFLDPPADRAPSADPVHSNFTGAIILRVAGIPDSVDRPQLVVETGVNELALLENDRWAEPLKSGVARTLSASLARMLPGSSVGLDGATASLNAANAWRVTVRIDALRLTHDGKAMMDAVWTVTDPRTGAVTLRRVQAARTAATRMPSEFVRLWSEELDGIARQIADFCLLAVN